jgi:hypothetical protein
MTPKLVPVSGLVWLSMGLMLLAGAEPRARAADMKFEATLVWGTDDAKPPEGKSYKAVEADIKKKLNDLPLKWPNWFEVNRTSFPVAAAALKKVAMSEKCELEVKNIADSNIEVALVGKGKEVMRRKQSLPKGEFLVLGGNAPNSTAWLVVLKRLE